MLAMQYSFTLPSDYDMAIIRRRIAANGHKMDGFPNLVFKAFLHASRNPQHPGAHENLYAPFYLWENNEGMTRFLASPGFAALTASFGWPAVKTWFVWQSRLSPMLAQATIATRKIVQIAPFSDLAELQEVESRRVNEDVDEYGALASLIGFEPGTWGLVRFSLWRTCENNPDHVGTQVYEVGHLAT